MHLNKSVQTNISSMVLYYQYITVRVRGSHVRSDKHFFYGLILPVHYSEDSWILHPFRQTFLLWSYITSTLQWGFVDLTSVQTNISSMVLYYQYITVRIRGSYVRSDKHFFYGLILPVHYSEDSWILRPFRQTFLLWSYITSTLQCVSITL